MEEGRVAPWNEQMGESGVDGHWMQLFYDNLVIELDGTVHSSVDF